MGYFSEIIHDSHIPARPTPTADLTPWTAPEPEPVMDRPRIDPVAETPPEGVERPDVGEKAAPTPKGKRRADIDIETISGETAVEAQPAGEWNEWTESSREKPPPAVATVQSPGPDPERSPLRHPFSFEEAGGRVESEEPAESADRPLERPGPNGAPPAFEAAVREAGLPSRPRESGPVPERDDAPDGPSPERPEEAPMAAPREPVLARVKSDPPRRPLADQGETRPDAYGPPGEWRADPGPPMDAGTGGRKTTPSPAPPQVRIGQVNVIVESPKPPSGPSAPERRGIDRNRRIFLRSL